MVLGFPRSSSCSLPTSFTMSLAMSRTMTSAASRSVARCGSVAPRLVAHRPHRRVSHFMTRATEEVVETAAPETTEAPESSTVEELSPIARAKHALEAESLDRASLESVVAEIEAEMARLQDAAAAAEARAAGMEATASTAKDQLIRLNADFENYRRRTQNEKDALADSVRGDIVVSLLPVVDNFELARTQVKAETEAEQKIQQSYQGLYKQFVEFLRNLGVEAVPTVGSPFDPNIHEAIMREPSTEVEDNTVLMEFRKGFRLGDKLLRAAMVKVSVNDGPAPEPIASSEE